jgi:hypothetical protein
LCTSDLRFYVIGCLFLLNLIGCGGVFKAEITDKETKSDSSQTSRVTNPCPNNFVSSGPCVVSKAGVAVTEVFGSYITTWSNDLASTSIIATIPNAFYANQQVQFTDADLVAGNILNGINIFGVIGTATAAYSPCTDEALNAGQCSTAANRYVYTAANGGRSANCAAGFNGNACWTNNTNQYMTGTLGGNITSWTNASSTTTVDGTIPLGYYSGNTIAFTEAALIASNIKSGVTIFNVPGSYTGGGVTLMSNMHRDRATTQITQETEAITNSGSAFPNDNPGYRAVPDINKDDDGYTGGSVTLVSRTNWDTTCDSVTGAGGGSANSVCKCGQSGAIEQRIADCASHSVIGSEATWNGAIKGNAGQGTWKLVTRTAALASSKGREVWRDERTKLLWSSLVSTSLNWCKASGSNFITNNPRAQVDPSNYCDNASYQTTGIWSAGVNKAISACFEDVDDNGASDFFTTTDAGIDNAGKGNLNLGSSPRVDWRLPTKYDFGTAETNGIRMVLPDMIPTGGNSEWSASIHSINRAFAWIFYGAYGYVSLFNRGNLGAVRCVGR